MTESQLDPQGEARAALNSTVTDFGPRILSDPRMLRSRLSDLLPDLPRERYLLITAAEADMAGQLTQQVQSQRADPETAIAEVSRSFSDSSSITLASSTWVTTEYAQALGYRVRPAAPPPPPPPPPSPAQPGPAAQPFDPNYPPTISPPLQTASPPAAAATVGPGGYPGYAPPQAPAGGGYAPPPQAPGVGQAPPAAVPQQGPAPPWIQPAPPSRTRNRWPIYAAVGVVVLGLVAGLLVWAPWHKVPVAPTALLGRSPTATSVRVSWTPSKGGATIDHYLILRDGTQVGSVPASQDSYLDQGLAPGTTHRYKVIALSGTQRSQPSASVTVRTITPSPAGLAAVNATWTSVSFDWASPPNSPTPSEYVIFANGAQSATLPGGTTVFDATGLQLGTTYQYQVVAVWGGHQSARSPALTVSTLAPPLQGSVSLQVKTLTTPGGGASLHVGETWSDSWTVTPTCTARGCTLVVNGEWAPPSLKVVPFTVNLTSSGASYAGSNTAYITKCGSVSVKNTVSLRLTADSGGVENGAWNTWHGSWVVSSPYTTENASTYCPSQSWTFSLTGT